MIPLIAIAMFALTMISLAASEASAEGGDPTDTYADIRADTYLIGTDLTATYTIYAHDVNGRSDRVSFEAKVIDSDGNKVGRVSPDTRSYVDSGGTKLTVTAPSDPGSYTLSVEFTFTDTNSQTVVVTKTAPVKVVTPIKLSATVDNSKGGTIYDMEVWFEVDGVKVEGSNETVTITAGSTKEIFYNWVTEALPKGEHTVILRGQIGPTDHPVEGLNTPVTFYVGQSDYTMTKVLAGVLLVVLLIILIVIYRKPVKNVGKPKARRRSR
jgi:hypothetical protein